MFTATGVEGVVGDLQDGTMTFPTAEILVETEVRGSLLASLMDEASYQGLMDETQEKLRQFRTDDGAVTMQMDALVITGSKRQRCRAVAVGA